ncbi:hypothetical protein WICPIJ_008975 [Wickerhamomyces pijperi]|uniref:Protein YIP n=1 Tax=Wickerhamomyces pijperi TaxID=599730 RepID=A0A9P8TFE7_WICPI|nr:hypothetical protein WICPIJ_008975 [Wickerhamomyces pijperi]
MAFYNQQPQGNFYNQIPQQQQSQFASSNPVSTSYPAFGGVQGTMDSQFAPSGSMNSSNNSGVELSKGILAAFSTSGYPNEPPLLEEIGINFQHIKLKTLAVLNPRGGFIGPEIRNDADLAGPLLFCLIFGLFLLLAGKVQFDYIYGVALFGTVSLFYFFKLMSDEGNISFSGTASVLGYCLLPLVPIAFVGIFLDLNNFFGYLLSALSIVWSTYSASGIFVAVLGVRNIRLLIAYPLAMFYSIFVLMAIFVEKTAN